MREQYEITWKRGYRGKSQVWLTYHECLADAWKYAERKVLGEFPKNGRVISVRRVNG